MCLHDPGHKVLNSGMGHTTCTHVKSYSTLWPCSFCWIRPVGFLINVYSVTSISLLHCLLIFSFQGCFLSTLLAPMSRVCHQLRPVQLSLHRAVSRICSLSVFCTDQASREPVDFRALRCDTSVSQWG